MDQIIQVRRAKVLEYTLMSSPDPQSTWTERPVMLLVPARIIVALQRVLLVALLAPAVVVAATAAIPGFALLPFLPGGTDRAVKLISAHAAYARALLISSRGNDTSTL